MVTVVVQHFSYLVLQDVLDTEEQVCLCPLQPIHMLLALVLRQ